MRSKVLLYLFLKDERNLITPGDFKEEAIKREETEDMGTLGLTECKSNAAVQQVL